MNPFHQALVSNDRNEALPEEDDFFGRLIGSWQIDYIDKRTAQILEGQWHFARVLEGMSVQDVIVLPGFEYGTTLRIYNPSTRAWDVAYGFTGKIMRFEARRQEDKIVLSSLDNDGRRKWVFNRIEDDAFHWQDITVTEDGEWQVEYDLYAKRI